MYCTNPQMLPTYFVSCGKCANCLRKKKYFHVSRMVAELKETTDATFVTLTYDSDNQPKNSIGQGILWKPDVQHFLKRLRFNSKLRLRMYYVGEYGSRTWRPHYHIALFGYPNCIYGRSRFSKPRGKRQSYCCGPCNEIRQTWGKGIVELGDLSAKSIGYTAGYIAKKLTQKGSPALEGRPPEFAQMSLRPGLGYIHAIRTIRTLSEQRGSDLRAHDIPTGFKHLGQQYAFDRYLRRLMRKWAGFETTISQTEYDDYQESYSTLPFLHATQGPTQAFLQEWRGLRQKYESKAKVKHETL